MYPILEKFTVVTGAAHDAKTAAFACVIDEKAEDPEDPHAAIYRLDDDTVKLIGVFDFSVVSVAYPDASGPAALGDWGKFVLFQGDTPEFETVPLQRGPLRKLAHIDGRYYASGGAMQVFRRDSRDDWTDISPSDALREEFGLQNLEAMDGYSASEIYAVGEFGVIWYYDGANWTPVQCQTNACFYSVLCAEDGWVYAAGQSGAIARGRLGDFELLYINTDIPDIWGLGHYRKTVYAAGFTALFLLDVENELTLIAEPLALASSYYDLSVANDVMWSIGMKDVMKFNEEEWMLIAKVNVA